MSIRYRIGKADISLLQVVAVIESDDGTQWEVHLTDDKIFIIDQPTYMAVRDRLDAINFGVPQQSPAPAPAPAPVPQNLSITLVGTIEPAP